MLKSIQIMLFAITVQFSLMLTCITQELSGAEQIHLTQAHAWNKWSANQLLAPQTAAYDYTTQRELHNDSRTIKLARFARLAVTTPAFVMTTCYTIVALIVCLTNNKDPINKSTFSTILLSNLKDRLPPEMHPNPSNFCLGLIDSINPWLNFTTGLMASIYLGSTLLIDTCKLQRSPKRRSIYYAQSEDIAIG